jgi:ABC-type multidrug transport system fused ATPase/permease subunit
MMDVTGFLVLPAVLIAGRTVFDHTLGELMSMIYAFSRVYSPMRKLARVHNNLRTLQGATKRVFEIMSTVPTISERPDAQPLPRHKTAIAFREVSFGYSSEHLVLRNISFKVKAGEMAAFVGSTGAGKSTLLDLIPRFYDVSSGRIEIDGVDLRDVTLRSLRQQIGIVNQEVILFHDSIAHNICYGKSECTPAEMIAAAKAAHAHGFIVEQSKGYATVIGDQGTLLSGGQRQRIAIARAILVDPSILILDEAASALDAESEALIKATIDKLKGNMTILVVAHRLSTVMSADRIFVMEQGSIVESGSRDELLAMDGRFRELHALQFSG